MALEKCQEDSQALDRYLRDLAAYTPLSAGEERALAARIKQGDLKARDRLVEANLRFVVTVAMKYRNCAVPAIA